MKESKLGRVPRPRFKLRQMFLRAAQHGLRHARQPGYGEPIALARRARLDLVQKYDAPPVFLSF